MPFSTSGSSARWFRQLKGQSITVGRTKVINERGGKMLPIESRQSQFQ
jgi:hypothetical protein